MLFGVLTMNMNQKFEKIRDEMYSQYTIEYKKSQKKDKGR